jgi:hypothetical protein
MKGSAQVIFLAIMPLALTAQTPDGSAAPSAASSAKSVGMFAYPKNNQNSDQQAKDESECYGTARQNSGVDPQAPAPAAPNAQAQQASQKAAAQQAGQAAGKGGTAKGAAGGAATGAAIGAITGNAGQGAAIGATAGAVAGRRTQKKAKKAAEQQAAQQTAQTQKDAQTQLTADQQQKLDTFKRSFSACLDARGYSII